MIGCDFERFLERNGRVITSEFLGLPSKFELPVPLDEGRAGAIHRDNVMVEFCSTVAADAAQFYDNVQNTLASGVEYLRGIDPSLGLSHRMSAEFSNEELKSDEAQELGCDADYVVRDANSAVRGRLNAGMLGNKRYCGGHLHFSWDSQAPAWVGAAVCDLFLAPAVQHMVDGERSKWYGLLGLHRPTEYPDGSSGCEYRALDSFWTANFNSLRQVSELAGVVHTSMNKGSFEFLQRLIKLRDESVEPGAYVRGCDRMLMTANADALQLFKEEFGYDPI